MVTTISHNGINSGFQAGVINGNITTQIVQSETLNQACLRDLRTTNPEDDKDRIQSTNGGLLKDSYIWILENEEFNEWRNNQSRRLLWIKGDPGKGKTMLLCGIIEELTRSFGDTTNISFFFCQATDVRINNATAVLRGLIYSIVKKQPALLSYVKSQYDHAGKALFEDINAWNALSRIFMDILKDSTLRSICLMIDALDECIIGLPSLLDLITQISSAYPHVKWIVSSRNWPDIEERLDTNQTALVSLELNEASISEAVSRFIQHKVQNLAEVKRYSDETRDKICHHLSSNSQGTFLWVALVCQDLDRTSRRHALEKLVGFPLGLDALYSRMIDQVRNSEDAEHCKRILAVMSVVYRPVAFDELAYLVELPDDLSDDYEALSEIIAVCGSFLTVREDTIVFVHQSAKEFLLKETQNGVFPGGIEAEHYAIFSRSLQAMFKTLRRDIFNLKLPGFPIEKVIPPSPNPLVAAKYACLYWVDHLQHSGCYKKDNICVDERGCVGDFLQKHYLHWLEALSILRSLSQGISAMLKLHELLQEGGESFTLLRQVRDASRFLRYHRVALESSPLQVYSSSLVFSPTLSLTRQCYQKRERPDWILNEPLVDKDWSSCLQTFEGHTKSVNSIAWSRDGSRLASASQDTTIRIWDPATGQCASILEGHIEQVNSVTWSQDGSQLASASHDTTVRIWDLATGQCETLKGHSGLVFSIAWSQDGTQLASASYDETVRIWDPATSQCELILEGHMEPVNSIAWSRDGSQLASASKDTVRIWDLATGQCGLILEGHSEWVRSIAWSQDGSQLALALEDSTIRIWNPATGQCALILEGHIKPVNSISWSQDGSRLASASLDTTVRTWDSATGRCASIFEGHSDWVRSVAWSQDGSQLASASYDTTVRIWDLATGQCASTLERHSRRVYLITLSRDGSRLASASSDNTVRIWDPATGQCELILEGHIKQVNSIAWSQDGSRLASASDDTTVRIWDPATGQCASILRGHSDWVRSVAWSQDGSQLASASEDNTIRIWDLATSQCASILEGHIEPVNSVTWAQDGRRLASTSLDTTVRIWDPATSQCELTTLEGHSDLVSSIAWSQDGSRLASASYDKTVRIWDPATGQCELILEGHSNWVRSVAWSQDGSRLASASYDRTVKILDSATGQCVSTSGSPDNTVRIWDPATGECESTLQISSPDFLEFDNINFNHLRTERGTFVLASTGPITSTPHRSASLPQQYGYGLNDDHSWITYDGVKLLWLPTEYRPADRSLFAVSATTLSIGCSSGRVIFLTLSLRNPISDF
ncbi:hypothetical protein N7451_001248 [Penicillium sp. IBT 35674x]|nr:hypothetical protein N7451_001248 [Penicillium sp. IBT 35674x]